MKQNENRIKNTSLIQIHTAVLLFGLAGLFGKLISMPSVIIVFGRTIFASGFLFLLLKYLKQPIGLREKNHYFKFAILGVVLALHWGSFFYSIQLSTVAIGLLTFSTFPIFVTFMEPWFFKEKIRRSDIITALITFAGVVLVIPEFKLDSNMTRGAIWGIVSGLTFAVLSILNRNFVKDYSSLVIAFYQNAVAALFLFPYVFIFKPVLGINNLLLIALLGVVFTGISHSLFISSMKNIKAQTASVIASLEPVYGIIATALIIGEVPDIRTILGGVVILCTAFYSTLKK